MIDTNLDFQQIKDAFLSQSKKYQEIIDEQLSHLKKGTGNVVLVTGAAFVIGFLLVRKFSRKTKNPDNNSAQSFLPSSIGPAKQSVFMKMFWESISMFLLAIAKKKLEEYLATAQKHDAQKENN